MVVIVVMIIVIWRKSWWYIFSSISWFGMILQTFFFWFFCLLCLLCVFRQKHTRPDINKSIQLIETPTNEQYKNAFWFNNICSSFIKHVFHRLVQALMSRFVESKTCCNLCWVDDIYIFNWMFILLKCILIQQYMQFFHKTCVASIGERINVKNSWVPTYFELNVNDDF